MDMYRVAGVDVNIVDTPWDFLVILDACRYDVFKHTIPSVGLKGLVSKAVSPATWTMEWLQKQFPGYYDDVVYISASPYVNSAMRVCHKPPLSDRLCYNAKHHFFKVVDVWDTGWDDCLGTVPPERVNHAFINSYLRFKQKRFILHYMQPHVPYLCLSHNGEGGKQYVPSYLQRMLNMVLSQRMVWTIKKLFGCNGSSSMENCFRRFGCDGIGFCYQYNVFLVLQCVSRLIHSITGRWLVTADHGERIMPWFGKPHGGHRDGDVVMVPWYVTDGGSNV